MIQISPNEVLHRTTIPMRSIAASELGRYANGRYRVINMNGRF